MSDNALHHVNSVAQERHLTHAEHRVMYALARRADERMVIEAMSFSELDSLQGMSTASVRGVVSSLIKKGLIFALIDSGKNEAGERLYRWRLDGASASPQKAGATSTGAMIYLVRNLRGNTFLIGKTVNMTSAMHRLTKAYAFQIKLEVVHATDNPWKLLRQLRREFRDKRISGEWYQLTEADVERIRNLKP